MRVATPYYTGKENRGGLLKRGGGGGWCSFHASSVRNFNIFIAECHVVD